MTYRLDSLRVDEYLEMAFPPNRVWRALVDPGERTRWWSHFALDARPDGLFEEHWRDANGQVKVTRGRVLRMTPPLWLLLSWADEDWTTSTLVDISLTPVGEATSEVRIVHLGWERLDDPLVRAEEHRNGWRTHLLNLRAYLEAAEAGRPLAGN